MKIIYKYLIREILYPFFLSLIVITFVLLFVKIDRIADNVINKGADLKLVLMVIGNLALYLFRITIPVAFLSGVLLALGRMSSENEILAFRSLGISLNRLFLPVFVMAFILAIFLLVLQDRVFPQIQRKIENIFYQIAKTAKNITFKEKEFIQIGDYTFYIDKLRGNYIKGVTVYEPVGNNTHRTITAMEGTYKVSKDKSEVIFNLKQGTFDEPKSAQSKSFYKMRFDNYVVKMPIKDSRNVGLSKSLSEMTFAELFKRAKMLKESSNFNLKSQKAEYYRVMNAIYKRITYAFAVVALALISIPIAIKIHRAEKSINFAVALFIVILYYVLLGLGEAITLRGFVFPFLTTSLPNIVFILTGIILYRKMLRI